MDTPAPAPRRLMVRATRLGFYPDPGAVRASVRNVGDVFEISCMEHFAEETREMPHGWMKWADAPVVAGPTIPQTTVPNQINDPLGTSRGAPLMVDRAEPGVSTTPIPARPSPDGRVAWPLDQAVNAVALPPVDPSAPLPAAAKPATPAQPAPPSDDL